MNLHHQFEQTSFYQMKRPVKLMCKNALEETIRILDPVAPHLTPPVRDALNAPPIRNMVTTANPTGKPLPAPLAVDFSLKDADAILDAIVKIKENRADYDPTIGSIEGLWRSYVNNLREAAKKSNQNPD
jgi:hypothetical protein